MTSQRLEAPLVFQDSLLSYRKGTAVSIVQVDLNSWHPLPLSLKGLDYRNTSMPHWLQDISTATIWSLRRDLSFSYPLNPNVQLMVGKESVGKLKFSRCFIGHCL